MDRIRQYQDLIEITPEYHKLSTPLQKLSIKRVKFNKQELELHYYNEFGTYLTDELIEQDILKKQEDLFKKTEKPESKNYGKYYKPKSEKKGSSEYDKSRDATILVFELDNNDNELKKSYEIDTTESKAF